MATIREKGPYQWEVQIRRKGWPYQNATFRSKKEAQAWARKVESEMDRGLFVDQTTGRETPLGELIDLYLKNVTANRPGEASRSGETCIRSLLVRVNPAQLDAALRTWHEAHGGGDSALAIDGKTIRGPATSASAPGSAAVSGVLEHYPT